MDPSVISSILVPIVGGVVTILTAQIGARKRKDEQEEQDHNTVLRNYRIAREYIEVVRLAAVRAGAQLPPIPKELSDYQK